MQFISCAEYSIVCTKYTPKIQLEDRSCYAEYGVEF